MVEINSCFRWSCSWRSFKVAMLSSVSSCASFRISGKLCSSFVRCALNPRLDETSLLSSAIDHSTKMSRGYDNKVGVPVTAPKMSLVELQYAEVPLTIGGIGEDSTLLAKQQKQAPRINTTIEPSSYNAYRHAHTT